MVGKISIQESIQRKEESKILKAIENFNCKDEEVERFLKKQALEFYFVE